MIRFFRHAIAVACVVLASSSVMAQNAVATASTPASSSLLNSVSVSETGTAWGKTNMDTVVELDSTLSGELYDMLGWHITVPVYSQDVTGYGAIDVGANYDLFKAENFLGGKANLSLEGGAWMPTGSAGYNTSNVNPHVGFNYDMAWGDIVYTQSFDIRWVGSYAYTPVFGTFTNYGLNAESFVAYKLGAVQVGADLNQWYTDGSNVAYLGPKALWQVAPNVSVSGGVGVPVWQESTYGQDNSWNATLGVAIKF